MRIVHVRIVDDDLQPGNHIASHYPHSAVVNVLRSPYTGQPYSPRSRFLKLVILPVTVAAVILAVIIAYRLGAF